MFITQEDVGNVCYHPLCLSPTYNHEMAVYKIIRFQMVLYESENWSSTLQEEPLSVFEDRIWT